MRLKQAIRSLTLVPSGGSSGSAGAGALLPVGLAALAEALRAAGIEAEIYDAMVSALGPDSIRLAIEHSYPQVVVAAACSATAEAARDVLRAAKEIVPGVFTVIVGAEPDQVFIHPVGIAGWFGLLVTSLNLLPAGQLDGGHVLYAAVGRRTPLVSGVLAAVLVWLAIRLWPGWLLWAAVIVRLLPISTEY